MNRPSLPLLAGVLVALASAPVLSDEVVAIKAGRIIPIAGDEIRGGVIVIKDGRIEAIGKDVEIPWDARVIDAADRVVMPGLVEPHTSRGLDRPNERVPNVPFVSVFDSIDPRSSYFEDAVKDGVTTILITPGNDTLIGGQTMILKPWGSTVEEMAVKSDVGLKISLRPTGGRSRMSHIGELRKVLRDMKTELAETRKQEAEKKEEDRKTARDLVGDKKRALADLLEGRFPAFVYCQTASDVIRAVALAKEFGIRIIPVLGSDGYKAAEVLAKAKLPAIVDPRLIHWERDQETGEEIPHANPTVLRDAGINFALQSTSSTLGTRFLWFQAAKAVRHGLTREEALRAITLAPAQIIGIADRVGSLEKGKDANLLILTGDPLDIRTWVDTVMIEGEVVYERSKDKTLEKLEAVR
ncbi:MAG: amidohydrolase family protein [Planctomycetota bacterium]|nr:amidohydrolase family protein [Planctomycetota bacterium]